MLYHFKIHKEKDGFWAQCIELPGCLTQAKSLKSLHQNMQEALNLYIEEPSDSEDFAALPDESIKKSKNVIEVPVDSVIAQAFFERIKRAKK